MRGIGVVIITGFISLLLFGVFAPAALEPIGQFVVSNEVVQDSTIDAQGMWDGLRRVIFIWAPLFVLGSGVVWAVRYYLQRERLVGRVR